jgi:tol-pal system-associated acyl-CoA thioesterase
LKKISILNKFCIFAGQFKRSHYGKYSYYISVEKKNMSQTKTHTFPFTIAYADTDAAGIVYHARYLEIAERARMDWIKGNEPPEGDLGFVIKEVTVKYLRALRVWDEITVETTAIGIGAASLTIEQKIMKDGELYAILTGIAAYLGANMRPKRIPEKIRNIIDD